MRIAVISDIHANLEATEACFKKIDELKPDEIVCLGDMVDYGVQPNECVDIIRSRVKHVVLGNHDEAQFDYEVAEGFSDNAHVSSLHTRTIINKEHVEYFKTLPRTLKLKNLFFVHGSPSEPEYYSYVLTPYMAEMNFPYFKEQICFIGHSHLPVIFEQNMYDVRETEQDFLDPLKRYIINVGSVGQPRDRDPRLSFGLLDTKTCKYVNVRVKYDVDSAAKKIKNAGLPSALAERLFAGK
jgi:predicted phosphodiesterase